MITCLFDSCVKLRSGAVVRVCFVPVCIPVDLRPGFQKATSKVECLMSCQVVPVVSYHPRFPHDCTSSFQLPRPQLATEDRFSFHNQKVLLSSSISRLLLLTNHFPQPNLRWLDASGAGGAAAEAAAGVGVPNPRGGYQEHRRPPQGKEAGELSPQGGRREYLQGRVVVLNPRGKHQEYRFPRQGKIVALNPQGRHQEYRCSCQGGRGVLNLRGRYRRQLSARQERRLGFLF